MATALSKLSIIIGGSASGAVAALKTGGSAVSGFASKFAGAGLMIAGAAATAAAALATVAAAGAGWAIKLANDAEQARASFTSLLGSGDAAKAMMADLAKYASATPFSTGELQDVAKNLLAFGVTSDQIIPTMRTLGDLAQGNSEKFGQLASIYGKMKTGKITNEDIVQVAEKGIPIYDQLAKNMGKTKAEVMALASEGGVGLSQIQQAFADLTAEGSQFGGQAEAQSKTLGGLWGSLGDQISQSMTQVGEMLVKNLDIKGLIAQVSEGVTMIGNYAIPLLEELFALMPPIGAEGWNAGQMVINGFEMIATGAAHVGDWLNLLKAGWKLLQAGAAVAMHLTLQNIDLVGGGLVQLLNLLPGVELEWTDTFSNMSAGALKAAEELAAEAGESFKAFQRGDNAKSVDAFFDRVRTKAEAAAAASKAAAGATADVELKIEQGAAKPVAEIEKITDAITKLKDELDTFGMSEADKIARDLEKFGASPAQIAEARAMQEKLDALEAQKKLQDELKTAAESMFDATRTDAEKHAKEIEKINDLRRRGLIDQETADRARTAADADLASAMKPREIEIDAPKLLEIGGADAARFVADVQRRQRTGDKQAQLVKGQQQGNKWLEGIFKNTTQPATGGTLQIATF